MWYIPFVISVFVEGLDLYGYHGVPAEERVVGHRYQVDVTLMVPEGADRSDDLTQTVDYGELAILASKIVQETQFFTVERLAGEIAQAALDNFPNAVTATVTVKKPLPPAPVIAAAAGATVSRHRG